MHAGRALNATKKGADPRRTIIAEKSTRARHLLFPTHGSATRAATWQTYVLQRPGRFRAACQTAQSSRLQVQSHHLWKPKNFHRACQSMFSARGLLRDARPFLHLVAGLRHQALRSLRSDDRTAFRHASFITLASANRSSGDGENAVCSQSQTADGNADRSIRRLSCRARISCGSPSPNGGVPVSAKTTIPARAKRSAAAPCGSP